MSLAVHSSRSPVQPFVDGGFTMSASDQVVHVTNPSTGQALFSIPQGCQVDVDVAVASARRAFVDGRWTELSPSARKRILHCFADLVGSQATQLDALDAEEMGKPIATGFCNASAASGLLRFYAESVDKVMGDVFSSDKYSVVAQRRVPRGVVAAVVPWNFPTYVAVLKLAPALAAGNCVVLKPSELSSRSAIVLAQLAAQAGIPQGVLNVVPGLGETVGRCLGLHADVDMISFTGSTEVGKLMLQYAGQSNLKFVMAECGGKSPHVVFADGVDLDAAAEAIAKFLLTNQGQICSVGSRLLVQRSIEVALVDKIQSHFQRIVMGDALDPRTSFGPLASAQQRVRVMRYIESAIAEGAKLVVGGHDVLPESGGYFVEPTIFRNVSPGAALAREEVFGPVLAVLPFKDVADAIHLANATNYGLGAYVWTSNISIGMQMAKGIRSSVRIHAAPLNGEGAAYAASSEPAGYSGVGAEGGLAGMESYLRRQRVWLVHE